MFLSNCHIPSISLFILALLLTACTQCHQSSNQTKSSESTYTYQRSHMVKTQIQARGVKSPKVLDAMLKVPRHLFIPQYLKEAAYKDWPLPIGQNQTISQPYIVAYMTELAMLQPSDRVLEIGTGSGYQAAVLGELCKEVYTIEIISALAKSAKKRLKELEYNNIFVKQGDGYRGWPEKAPFDVILVTAAPNHVPQTLVDQLKINGRLVMPVGEKYQEMIRITKTKKGISKESLLPVRFVPMTGEAQN